MLLPVNGSHSASINRFAFVLRIAFAAARFLTAAVRVVERRRVVDRRAALERLTVRCERDAVLFLAAVFLVVLRVELRVVFLVAAIFSSFIFQLI
jgi:hypothetical protein